MGQSVRQSVCLDILTSVLLCLYRAQPLFVARRLTFFHQAVHNSQNLISPDLAIFLGMEVAADQDVNSWDMRVGQVAPHVVFEISSQSTWQSDVTATLKPLLYGQMGVREYIACDANQPAVWGGDERVRGWRYDERGRGRRIKADQRGWVWSAELGSFVGYEGHVIRLYDAAGQRRPTREEADQAVLAARAAQQVTLAVEQAALQQAEARVEILRRALREHGIDPEALTQG